MAACLVLAPTLKMDFLSYLLLLRVSYFEMVGSLSSFDFWTLGDCLSFSGIGDL